MFKKELTILVVASFLVISVFPDVIGDNSNFGITIYVDGDGSADYTKIQDAIDNANNGDIVFVYNGIYYENVIINKSISLIGEDRYTTIVDGGGLNDTILVTSEWVTVSNLGVTNSGIDRFIDAGIHITANYASINDNYVFINEANGILLESIYSIVYKNQVNDNRLGIKTRYADSNIIIENYVNNSYSNGIYFALESIKNTMYKNKVTNCNDALVITESNDNIIRENNADSNDMNGLYINRAKRTIVYGNNFSNNRNAGINLQSHDDNTIYNNNFIENGNNNYDWPGGNNWFFDYPVGGNYWDDYFDGSDDYQGPDQDIPGSDGIWDDPYYISISLDIDKYPYSEPNGWVKEPVGPDLDCLGMISWDSVKPNTEQTGRILLFNNGKTGSLLDWEVEGLPEWGGCTITPDHGNDLSPEDGYIPLTVTITAPDEQEQSFSGEIKIVNKDNSSDYHIFTVSLTTAKAKTRTVYSLILQFLENHPRLFPILRQLLGL